MTACSKRTNHKSTPFATSTLASKDRQPPWNPVHILQSVSWGICVLPALLMLARDNLVPELSGMQPQSYGMHSQVWWRTWSWPVLFTVTWKFAPSSWFTAPPPPFLHCGFVYTINLCGGGGGFFLASEDYGRMFDYSFTACSLFSFFFIAHTHKFISSGQLQSKVAQQAETTVAKCSLTSCVSACFQIGSHTMPGQWHS